MMKLDGNPFENSPVCRGVGYVVDGASMDMARINLTGRYPERGWVMNEVSYEMAYVARGSGTFTVKGGERIPIKEEDIISIETSKPYAWEGTMTLIVSCNPPFDPTQHKQLEEN